MSTSAPSVDSSRRPLPAEKVAFSIPRPAHLLPFAPPCSAPPPKPSNYLPSLALSTRRTDSRSKHSSVIYSITCLHGLDAALHYICPIFTGTFFSCDHGSIVVVATLPNIYHSLSKSFFFRGVSPTNYPGCSDLCRGQGSAVLFASWFICGTFRHAPLATIIIIITTVLVSSVGIMVDWNSRISLSAGIPPLLSAAL